jgi:cytochrome c oxidase subunit II
MNAKLDGLFWLMTILGGAIYVGVMAFLAVAFFRRGRPQDSRFILVGGVALPAVVLVVLAVATVRTTNAITAAPKQPVRIDVVGYQYWWEARYPANGAVTANEIHIPANRDVELRLTSVDVIHSFWVPELAGKVDLIPGRQTTLKLHTKEAGEYRGVCAEFCGLQHTKMGLLVIAEPAAAFEEWLRQQASPATAPNSAFENSTCAGCHTVRGTDAKGTTGPDLTHFGSRRTLGALAAANTPANLRDWIANAQDLKPGNAMPPVGLTDQELDELVAYLESLQ